MHKATTTWVQAVRNALGMQLACLYRACGGAAFDSAMFHCPRDYQHESLSWRGLMLLMRNDVFLQMWFQQEEQSRLWEQSDSVCRLSVRLVLVVLGSNPRHTSTTVLKPHLQFCLGRSESGLYLCDLLCALTHENHHN